MAERGERSGEEWISAQDISLRDLVGPEHLLREAVQRRRVGSSEDELEPTSLDALAPGAARAAGPISADQRRATEGARAVRRAPLGARGAADARAPHNARVRAYRMYLVKHIGIMTCAPASLPVPTDGR